MRSSKRSRSERARSGGSVRAVKARTGWEGRITVRRWGMCWFGGMHAADMTEKGVAHAGKAAVHAGIVQTAHVGTGSEVGGCGVHEERGGGSVV